MCSDSAPHVRTRERPQTHSNRRRTGRSGLGQDVEVLTVRLIEVEQQGERRPLRPRRLPAFPLAESAAAAELAADSEPADAVPGSSSRVRTVWE
jgi:hypothetical protein